MDAIGPGNNIKTLELRRRASDAPKQASETYGQSAVSSANSSQPLAAGDDADAWPSRSLGGRR